MPEEILEEILRAGQQIDISSLADPNIYELVSDSGQSLGFVQEVFVVIGDEVRTIYRSITQDSASLYTTTGYAFMAADVYTLLAATAQGLATVALPVLAAVLGYEAGKELGEFIESKHPGWLYDLQKTLWESGSTVNGNVLLYYSDGTFSVPVKAMAAYIQSLADAYMDFNSHVYPMVNTEKIPNFNDMVGYFVGAVPATGYINGSRKIVFANPVNIIVWTQEINKSTFTGVLVVNSGLIGPKATYRWSGGKWIRADESWRGTDTEPSLLSGQDSSAPKPYTANFENFYRWAGSSLSEPPKEIQFELASQIGVPASASGIVQLGTPSLEKNWSSPKTGNGKEIQDSYPIELNPLAGSTQSEVQNPKPMTDPLPTIESAPLPSPEELPSVSDTPIPPPEEFPPITPAGDPNTGTEPQPNLNPGDNPNSDSPPVTDPDTSSTPNPDTPPVTNPDPNLPPPSQPDVPPDNPPLVTPLPLTGAFLPVAYWDRPSMLSALNAKLWSTDLLDTLARIWSDPMNAIISTHFLPISVTPGAGTDIYLGSYNTGVTAQRMANPLQTINMGSVTIPDPFKNPLDYPPYTSLRIYLPYIGYRQLDMNECAGKTLSLLYNIDLLTGACVALISSGNIILYTFSGAMAYQVPLTALDAGGLISSVVNAGLALYTGGASITPAVVGATLRGATSNVFNTDKTGSIAGQNGYLGPQQPFVVYEYHESAMPNQYGTLMGKPAYANVNVGNCKGYSRFKNIKLQAPATQLEKSEIIGLLEGGVFID